MANKEETLGNSVIEAIATIAQDAVSKAGYDKTIKATIVSNLDASKGIYVCKYDSVSFTAIGTENAYQLGDLVMVNVPQNNWDNPKTILNKIYAEVLDYNTLDPFADFLDVHDGQPLIFVTDPFGVTANKLEDSTTTIKISDFSSAYTEPYSRMGIGISFNTGRLIGYHVNGGTYGVRIKFMKDSSVLAQYELNNSQCFGNLYGFEDYTPFKILVPVDSEVIGTATDIRVEGFQSNDFTCYNTVTGQTERLNYGQADPDKNILFKDLKLYFGYGREEYKEGDIILTTSSPLQYYRKWSEEANTKYFSWVYWTTENGKLVRKINPDSIDDVVIQYTINGKDWEDSGRSKTFVFSGDFLEYTEVSFRVRITKENFDSETGQRYSYYYSNSITFIQYVPVITSQEIDSTQAIQMKYIFRDKFMDWDSSKEKDYYEVTYNRMENQLCNQYEFLLPHDIDVEWKPITASYQDPGFLAGATVTYKIPAFEQKRPNDADGAANKFNFEKTTIFMHPRPGYEYSSSNNTVHYEAINDLSYLVWSITLSNDFVYDTNRFGEYHNWDNFDQQDCDSMQALTLSFRVKEQYLPTMVNNTVYCVITKGDQEFTSSFEVPIKKPDLSETAHMSFILTEDFEKPYIVQSNWLINEKVFHFCVYQQDYTGKIVQDSEIRLLRPFENFTEYFKKGYWYQNDNNEFVKSSNILSNIQWYTLRTLPQNTDFYAFLMLQVKINGICNIKEIPIFSEQSSSEWIMLDGINKIYCDASGVSKEKTYGPEDLPISKVQIYFTPIRRSGIYYTIMNHKESNFNSNSQRYNLKSYELNKNNVFAPIPQRRLVKSKVKELMTPNSTIPINDPRNFYIKSEEEYIKGDRYDPEKIVWRKNGEELKTITLPYHTTSEDYIYIDEDQQYLWYITADDLGFTSNYKEAGTGEDYPAESLIYYYTVGIEHPSCCLPIVFQQRQLFRDDFAQWDGTEVHIGDDAVYSPVIGAGRKNNGAFTGCLMGDVSTIDFNVSGFRNYYGLYGYKDDIQSFGLRADGGMFLGKEGHGQLLLDGNNSSIQSSRFKSSKENKGMKIDFDDAIIKMVNNVTYVDEAWKNQKIAEIDAEINDQIGLVDPEQRRDDSLLAILPNMYESSGVWDYVKVPALDTYDVDTQYFYVEDRQTTDEYIQYYTQDEMLIESEDKYYVKTEVEGQDVYVPHVVPSGGESVYFITEDQTPDLHKTYYILEQGEYIGQYFKEGDSFDPLKTYYERNYFYEKVIYKVFTSDLDKTLFEGAEQQWNDMRQQGIVFYTRTVGSYPSIINNQLQMTLGPIYGWNIRVQSDNTVYDTPPQTDDKIYYFYKIKDGNDYNVDTYFLNSWMHYEEDIDPETTVFTKYLIGNNISNLIAAINARMRSDLKSEQQLEQYNISINEYNKYENTINSLNEDLESYTTNFKDYYERDKILAEKKEDYHSAEQAWIAAREEWEQAQQQYQPGSPEQIREQAKYADAEDKWIKDQAAWGQAQDNYDNAKINFDKMVYSYNILLRNVNIYYLSYLLTLDDLKPYLIDYNSYYVDNVETQSIIEQYEDSQNTYLELLRKKQEYLEMSTDKGIPYGIKIDASDDNITTTSGEIDENKYPLMIGNLSTVNTAPFKVNWAGEMQASAGTIGGWSIGETVLESTSGSQKFILNSSSTNQYPLQIGDKFKVDWEGNIYAKKIDLQKGTLDGNGASIKNVKQITYTNGKGLTLSNDGYLHLDTGLYLGNGGAIRTETGSIVPYSNGFQVNGAFRINSDSFFYAGFKIQWCHKMVCTGKDQNGQLRFAQIHYLGYY